MRALTLHRPWPWSIFHLDAGRAKRTENRTWPPPASLIGEFVALHAGLTWDDGGATFIARVAKKAPPPEAEHPTGIVGVARVVGVRMPYERAGRGGADPWYMGSVGWKLADVVALAEPVACRGRQCVWTVPEPIAHLVREQLPREVASCV